MWYSPAMAFRIHDSVVRGEIDNREKGIVRGRIWVHGREAPVILELKGNAHFDLAGCFLSFENPGTLAPHQHLGSLDSLQHGVVGDITASRKVRVFDLPFEEAYAMIKRGEKPPEHLANSLYLEWFSKANGRVVIESSDYRLKVSPPQWQLSAEEEAERSEGAAAGFSDFMQKVTEASDPEDPNSPQDREMDEFEWEKSFRESDALTEKMMELEEKYGDNPDFEEILAREMGWDSSEDSDQDGLEVDEANRICAEDENDPLEPDPLTQGIDWVPCKDGGTRHPLVQRISDGAVEFWRWCHSRGLLGEDGDTDLADMIFHFQSCGAKCAGALGRLAYPGRREPGFIVARLKRALVVLNRSLEAASKLQPKHLIPEEKLAAFRAELFAVREEILGLMERFRGEQH